MMRIVAYILLAPAFLAVVVSAVLFYAATWLLAYNEGWPSITGYALAHVTLAGLILLMFDERRRS